MQEMCKFFRTSVLNFAGLFKALESSDIFAQNVEFDIHYRSHFDVAEVGILSGIRNDGNGKCVVCRITDGERNAVNGNAALVELGFHDASFGDITVENTTLDDQVLLKRDGLPTYNFANVIDDHLMGITHVVRGSEYLSSAPKYNLLYEGFGWEVPTYVHCSPVMRDAQHKMSKRNGDPSYEDLKAQGYLTPAILNYVALLGWSPRGEQSEQEFFTLDELVGAFDIGGISKSPAIFDIEKLTYFNANYLRNLPPEEFCKVAEPYIRQAVKNEAYSVGEIAALLQARCEKLTDIPEKVDFFDALPEYGVEFYTNKKSKTNSEVSLDMLNKVLPKLESLPAWTNDAIHDMLVSFAEELGVKNATLMWPLRIAVAGKLVTPGGAVEICHILGREETIKRVKAGIAKLA